MHCIIQMPTTDDVDLVLVEEALFGCAVGASGWPIWPCLDFANRRDVCLTTGGRAEHVLAPVILSQRCLADDMFGG